MLFKHIKNLDFILKTLGSPWQIFNKKIIFHDTFKFHRYCNDQLLGLLYPRRKREDWVLAQEAELTFVIWILVTFQAASHLEEYNETLELILKWIDKAKILVHGKIAWNSANQLREQYISHQVTLGKLVFKRVTKRAIGFNWLDWQNSEDHGVKLL